MFHQLYAEFSADIIPALVKTFHTEKDNLVKGRSLLRLLTELYIYGVYNDHTVVLDIVKQIVVSWREIAFHRTNEYCSIGKSR